MEPGLGKTSTTLATFAVLKHKGLVDAMLVLAPLRVCHSTWINEPAKWDFSANYSVGILHGANKNAVLQQKHDIYVLNYDGLGWFVENAPKDFPHHMLVADECFVRGTRISTPEGEVPVEKIREGQEIVTDTGPRRVLDISRREAYALVELRLSSGRVLRCTPEHPIFTDVGWVCAKDAYGRKVFTEKCVSDLRKGSSEPLEQGQDRARESVLLEVLRAEEEVSRYSDVPSGSVLHHGRDEGKDGHVVEQGVAVVGGGQGEASSSVDLPRAVYGATRGKRYWNGAVRGPTEERAPRQVYHKLPSSVGKEARRLSYVLQSGLWRPFAEGSNRGGWKLAQPTGSAGTGLEEGRSAGAARVESVSYHECRGGEDVWNLQVEGTPRYFAENTLVHNCTKLKHSNTQRFKTLKKILGKFRRRYILTGTPAPNGLMDLFGQCYVMDMGASLGQYITHFRSRFFNQSGYQGYEWVPKPGAMEEVQQILAPRVLTMKAEDYLTLPELVEATLEVALPRKAQAVYDMMERDMRLLFESGQVTAANSAVASMKCRQLAGGFVYGENHAPHYVHEEKLEALSDLVEELSGQPALVAYEFEAELELLRKHFPQAVFLPDVKMKDMADLIARWHRKEVPLLFANPASMAHGVDGLQGAGRAVIWYTPTWNLEYREQFIRRIWRQGQPERVFVYNIIAKGTVDEVVAAAVAAKHDTQSGLMSALKEYWKKS